MCLQAMPGTAPASTYDMYSAAALACHKSVLWPILMDDQPYSWVEQPGTVMQYRILSPMYELHSATFYRDMIGKVTSIYNNFPSAVDLIFLHQIYDNSIDKLKAQLAAHNPSSVNIMLDGWCLQ